MHYPVRCRIIDVTGIEVFPGIIGATPEVSKQHIGKLGWANRVEVHEFDTVEITLDDGAVLMGFECWWEEVKEG